MLRSVTGLGRIAQARRSYRHEKYFRSRGFLSRLESLERRTLLSSGDLDPTFGTGGKVNTDIPGAASDELIRGVALQSDGGMVEVAWHGGFGNTEPRLAVTRFNPDGSVDTSFGDNGLRVIDYPGRGEIFGNIAVGRDDQVVVAGWSNFPATNPLPEDQDVLVAVLNADGSFDTSFDGDGIALVDVGRAIGGPTAAKTNDLVFDVAVQDDGKVVTAGLIGLNSQARFALVRLNTDGTLDTTFDGDGVVTTPFANYDAIANSVDIDASGRIVVAGQAGIPTGSPPRVRDNDFAVARYNPNGSLDATFDGDGWAITPFGTLDDIANQVQVADDGKIVVGGGTQTGGTSLQDVAIARYNANGTLDTTFSGDGKATYALTNATGGATNETALGMAVQADGAVLFSGRNTQGIGTSVETFLVRLTPAGVPDPGFGTNGKLTVPDLDSASAIAVQPADQYILVGGQVADATFTGFADFGVIRYDPFGNPDTSFGQWGTGVATADFMATGFNIATSGAVQPDGKVVVAGQTIVRNSERDIVILRYNADGTLDEGFGAGGIVQIDLKPALGVDGAERVNAITLDADGKIVFAGTMLDPNTNTEDMLVGRLLPDGSLDFDFAFGSGMLQVGSFAGNPDGNETANDVLVDPDGRVVVVGEYSTSSTVREFAVMRLDSFGNFDTSFGPDGSGGVHVRVVTTGTVNDATANAVALAPDQDGDGYDLVVAGRARVSSVDQFGLIRLNDDGALDFLFGAAGRVTTSMGSSTLAFANDVAVDASGRVVAAGQARGTNNDFALARYGPDGVLDTNFGTAGRVLTDFDGENDTANSLVFLPDGSILVGGTASANWGLARYGPDGALDTTFATAGRARTDFATGFYPGAPATSRDSGQEVFLYPDDRVVMVGTAFPPMTGSDFAAARYVLSGPPNAVPVADAGGPYSMVEGSTITLSGAASSDADGRIERYEWDLSYDQFLGFSTDAFGPEVPFTAPDEGPKRVALRVTDEDGAMHLVQITVNVTNAIPVVSAGPDATIDPGATFTANGSFADPGAGDTWTGSVDYGDGLGFQALTLAANKTFALSHAYATPGIYTVTVRVRDNDGGEGTDTVVVNVRGAENHVNGRRIFYHRSRFGMAVPDQKQALLPGGTAVGVNITNYTRGINGIIVTLDGAPGGTITAADFRFKVGTGGDPGTWVDAPVPERVEVRGIAGSPGTEIVITWPDFAIINKWLQVTTLANARTKLASPDTFYYGNLVGNAASPPGRIDQADYLRTRASLSRTPVPVTNPSDHDHDGQVTALDVAAVKRNLFQSIQLITAPAAAAPAAAVATAGSAPSAPATAGSSVWAAAVTARREALARATDLLK